MFPALIVCTNLFFKKKKTTKELGCMSVILLHNNHRHVSATHVTVFRVVTAKYK